MSLMQKISLYEFVSDEQRRWALYLLTQAAAQGKKLDDLLLVFDRWGGISLMETKNANR
jgi:hypothetical protein